MEKGVMKKKSFFWKYLIINLSLVFIIVIGCVVNIVYTYNCERKTIIKQNQNNLERSIDELERILNSLYSLSSALRSNTSIQALSRYKGDELPADQYVLKTYLKKDLSDIQMIANISGTGFVLFRDNQVFVSNAQTAEDYRDYYGTYLEAEGKSADEFKQEIMECTDPITLKTYPSMIIYNSGLQILRNPLVVVNRIKETNNQTMKTMAFVFVIDCEELYKELFGGNDAQNLFCICDKSGTVLNTFGSDAEALKEYINEPIDKNERINIKGADYYLQKAKENVNGSSIVLAIPEEQVRRQTMYLVRINLLVTVIAIILSVITIIFFSYKKSSSMQEIIDDINERSQTRFVNGDEYKFIRMNVEHLAGSRDAYRKELSELRAQVHNNLLEQMFFQETMSAKMEELCKKLVPFEIEYYSVLVFQCEEEGYDILSELFYMINKLSDQYIEGNHFGVQTGANEISFLVERKQNELIQKESEKKQLELFLQTITQKAGEILHIGISGIGMEMANIHTCYVQAKQALACYSRDHMNTIGAYSDLVDKTGDNLLNLDYIAKLYQYLLSGKKEPYMAAVDKLCRHYNMNPHIYGEDTYEIYYAVRQTIVYAAMELSVPEDELRLPKWHTGDGLGNGLESLKNSALRLLEAHENNKKSHNDALKDETLQYIENNFQDASLTALIVCQEMKISEKYLAQFLKEQTGKSFSKYVEDLRVKKAKELLLATDYSNEKIAKECGFGSLNSFYRVFNKKTGVSPGAFRNK